MEKNMWQITFLPEEIKIHVPDGTTLLEAERMAGILKTAPCGGRGLCGKCRRILEDASGVADVLACRTKVTGDVTVRSEGEENARILTEGIRRETVPGSGIHVISIQVQPVKPGEADSILERVTQAAAAAVEMDPKRISADPDVIGSMYRILQETEYCCYAVLYCGDGSGEILELSPTEPELYLFAVDIGTTTMAGYLMNAESGAVCARVSRMNPQTAWGADVISRADYALHHGVVKLTEAVQEAVAGMAEEAALAAGIKSTQIVLLTAAGNTCMHHLFLGISPESLVKAPYSAAIRDAMEMKAYSVCRNIHPKAVLRMLPNLAGFVGADTSACLLATEFDRKDRTTLLLDIGTNGEMVLASRGRRVACSTAAGPAFEGAKIACGMRGAKGAIDHVWMDHGTIRFSVIGGGSPAGICGSGLMDAAAVLLEAGYVDASGVFVKGKEAENRYYFIPPTDLNPGIYLSQKDLSELQLAKAAIAAGIRILCRKLGIGREDIEEVLIAGAFGTYMNPDSACRIGLLPQMLRNKIRVVGNAAGEGARLAAVSRKEWKRCCSLAENTEFTELAAEDDFSDFFVEELEFPENR